MSATLILADLMDISGPDSFRLQFDADTFRVVHPNGARTFSGSATSKKPKLYVVSVHGSIVYVGITKQSLRNRLRLGWSANGESGYYGYHWRHHLNEADLDVWYHEDALLNGSCLDIETIEAEVVFLIRQLGQWPRHQTEIHFHASSPEHRDHAQRIVEFIAQRTSASGNGESVTA